MPKKKKVKFKFPKLNLKILGAVLGAVVITTAAGGIIYAKSQGLAAALRLGGVRAGIWFDPNTGEPNVETGKFGCCRPMCSDSFELECQQLSEGIDSASFDTRMCTHVEECQEGCCQIDCKVKKLPQEACEYMGGDWSDTCEIGCCKTEYSENELPEKTCLCDSSASWYEGTCAKGFYVILSDEEAGKVDFTDDFNSKSVGSKMNALADKFGSRDADLEIEYYLYTCDETPNGIWNGTKTTKSYSGASKELITKSDNVKYDLSDGSYSLNKSLLPSGFGLDIAINGNVMSIDQKMPLVSDLNALGTIHMGAKECDKR